MGFSQTDYSTAEIDSLLNADNEQWFQYWLDWAIKQVPGTEAALVVVDVAGSGGFAPRAMFPLETLWESRLLESAEQTLSRKTPLIKPLETEGHYVGSWPVCVGDQLYAVVTLVLKARSEAALHDALATIEWCAGWLELHKARENLKNCRTQIDRQQRVLDGIAGVLGSDSFEHAALYYVNVLSSQLSCDRVVLGFLKAGEVEIHSQSDSSTHSDKHALMKLTAAAMQEAVDQKETVCWPPDENVVQVNTAHRDLNDGLGVRAFLTVPLFDHAECFGVVLFERHSETPFTQDDIVLAEALSSVVADSLEQKRQAELPLYVNIKRALELQLERMVGPGFLWRKVALGLTLLLTLFFIVAKGEYNLAADAVLEGEELRAMVAPFDSYIETANYRAGDRVQEGELLAELDTRELRLQRMSWLSQMAQAQRQYEDALAKQERADVQVSYAKMQRAKAEMELVEYQIKQARLIAPFDALVVTGDLSQRIGTAIKLGDTLFELAPSERFRLALYVDEFRIADVQKGQSGTLVLSALSDLEFPFTVTRINPVAEVRDGATVYRVEADIEDQRGVLRAGLEGVAQISIDRRHLIAIWTRQLRDRLALEWWRFWG